MTIKFEHSVKPYYYPSDDCSIIYSAEKQLSLKTRFKVLNVEAASKKFGFNLICGDIFESTNAVFKYLFDNSLPIAYPKSLGALKNSSPEVYSDTNKIFILHKSPSKMGLEVVSGAKMEKGIVVAEYLGEELLSRGIVSDTTRGIDTTYIINHHPVHVDAKYYGNIARFFNHCPTEHSNPNVLTANLAAVPWQVSETITQVFFITTREIEPFEPICWDYGSNYQFDQPVELLDANTYLPINDYNDL